MPCLKSGRDHSQSFNQKKSVRISTAILNCQFSILN